MEGKTKADTENGANASDVQKKTRRARKNGANASSMQRKQVLACKMMQMQAICKENRCWHAKRCKCKLNQKQVRQSLIYMHEKTECGNNACNANEKAMDAI